MIAGISFWRFYFDFFNPTTKGPQIVTFLPALRKQVRHSLLIIWDDLPVHRRAFASLCGFA